VDIAPDMVDVNVHPTKTEVKFTRDHEVHHAVGQAVKSALLTYGVLPTLGVEGEKGRRGSANGYSSWQPSQSRFTGGEFETLARAAVDLFRPQENQGQAYQTYPSALTDPNDPFAAIPTIQRPDDLTSDF